VAWFPIRKDALEAGSTLPADLEAVFRRKGVVLGVDLGGLLAQGGERIRVAVAKRGRHLPDQRDLAFDQPEVVIQDLFIALRSGQRLELVEGRPGFIRRLVQDIGGTLKVTLRQGRPSALVESRARSIDGAAKSIRLGDVLLARQLRIACRGSSRFGFALGRVVIVAAATHEGEKHGNEDESGGWAHRATLPGPYPRPYSSSM
jgi:hypothetical protein